VGKGAGGLGGRVDGWELSGGLEGCVNYLLIIVLDSSMAMQYVKRSLAN
jgi:hypothetical protein